MTVTVAPAGKIRAAPHALPNACFTRIGKPLPQEVDVAQLSKSLPAASFQTRCGPVQLPPRAPLCAMTARRALRACRDTLTCAACGSWRHAAAQLACSVTFLVAAFALLSVLPWFLLPLGADAALGRRWW
jgi:hypothetical protein